MRTSLKISAIAVAAAMLTTLPAAAVSINLGGNDGGAPVSIGGTNSNNANATVGTNALGGSGGNDATANVNPGGGNNGLLDLGGNDPTTANANLGGSNGTNGDVLLDLFGNGGSGSSGRVALGSGATSTNGGNTNAVIDLFGNGGGGSGGGGANGGSGGGSNGGSNGGVGAGGGASGSGGLGIPGARTVGSVQVAAQGQTAAKSSCFTPNAEQVAKLVGRHDYGSAVTSWSDVANIKVVDVNLCDGAADGIVGQANIRHLQSYISDREMLRDGIAKLGRSPGQVIGADKSGQTLTVYVM